MVMESPEAMSGHELPWLQSTSAASGLGATLGAMRRSAHPILFLVLLATGLLAAAFLLPLESRGRTVAFSIRPGDGPSSISRRLVEEGHLATWQRPGFVLAARLTGLQARLRPGVFQVPASNSIWRIVRLFETATPRSLRVTLPEGRTCRDFAGILSRQWLGDSATFATLCRDSAFAAELGIPGPSLEGYLFPDTYAFDGGESPKEVFRFLKRRFDEVLAEIGDSSSPVWKAHGRHGMVTLASIVEREAAVRNEAPRISGVFWLRLGAGIPLGADPTVRYALDKFTGSLTKTDLALESPYNSRLFAGLPPGPIANPGRLALQAAMAPDTTGGWLYFVAKDDGSREHFFGRTLNEHVRYKRVAERNRASSGVMTP